MEESKAAQEVAIVEKAINGLAEHFDTVQVFVTRYIGGESTIDHGSTLNISKGTGNWHARVGQTKEWILKEDEAARDSVRLPP